VNPSAAPAETPAGVCKPIGLTASGEAVFPFQCKEFIEQHREKKGAEQKPPFAEDKRSAIERSPAEGKAAAAPVEEKGGVERSAAVGSESTQSINKPVEIVSFSRRVKDKPRVGSAGCQRYRTYDSESGSYRGYDKRRHSCR